MNVFVFHIKTVPDIDGARRLYDLHGLSDDDVAKAIFHKRRQQANTEVLQHHLHKIVAISGVLTSAEQFKVWSLGDENSTEQDLLQRFYDGLERYTPQLISWDGSGFDLPVIHYRSLLYPINAQRYWETGQHDNQFQNNNYQSRYHERHTDLMDVLAAYQPQAAISQDEMATLCGFPGKMTMQSSQILNAWLKDDIKIIRDHGEMDVLNTYLVFLNWQRNRGMINPQQYDQQCSQIREALKQSAQTHLLEFEKNWLDL